MENKYYAESMEKNTRYRKEYEEGIATFLKKEKEKAYLQRKQFISPSDYKANAERYRREFINMVGFPLNQELEKPKLLEKTFVIQDGNVKIYRMQFLFLKCIKFYGVYFEQVNADKNTPFIIGLHGGEGTPELVGSMHFESANYNHLVRRITDKGANVFAPQLLLWSKQNYGGEYDRNLIDGKLRMLGGSITALELYLLRGCVDYFTENENINETKIGTCGMSYGGMYALHLAAIDMRVKACYSCSWVCDGFVYSWPDWSYKNAQNTFAVAETAALIAPRALVVGMGNKDELFDWRLTKLECEDIERFYREFDAQDNFKTVIYDGVHEFDKTEAGIDFLLKSLR